MANDCDLKPFGRQDCDFGSLVTRRLAFWSTYASDNVTANKYASVSGVTKTALQTDINETKAKDKLMVTDFIESVVPDRLEDRVQEFDTQRQVFIKDGVYTFEGFEPNADPSKLKGLKSFGNTLMSTFLIDEDGNWVYLTNASGEVLPFQISKGSFNAYFKPASATERSGIMYRFRFEAFKEENIRLIKADDLDFDALSRIDLYQNIQVTATVEASSPAPSTASFQINLSPAVSGLLLADFTLTDSAGSPVTPDTVTEQSGGASYLLEKTSFASGDIDLEIAQDQYNFIGTSGKLLGDTPLVVTIP